MTELSAGTRVIFTDSEEGATEAGVIVSFYPVSAKFAAEEGSPGSAGEYAIKLDNGAGAVAWPHELVLEDEQVIPVGAVEAAADALREAFDMGVGGFEEQARIMLEAAAPHMHRN